MLWELVSPKPLWRGHFRTYLHFSYHLSRSYLWVGKRLPYIVNGAERYTEPQNKLRSQRQRRDGAYPKPVSFSNQWSRFSLCRVSLINEISSCLLATRALFVENLGSVGRSGRAKIVSAKSLN